MRMFVTLETLQNQEDVRKIGIIEVGVVTEAGVDLIGIKVHVEGKVVEAEVLKEGKNGIQLVNQLAL